jgi:hypothetical protein
MKHPKISPDHVPPQRLEGLLAHRRAVMLAMEAATPIPPDDVVRADMEDRRAHRMYEHDALVHVSGGFVSHARDWPWGRTDKIVTREELHRTLGQQASLCRAEDLRQALNSLCHDKFLGFLTTTGVPHFPKNAWAFSLTEEGWGRIAEIHELHDGNAQRALDELVAILHRRPDLQGKVLRMVAAEGGEQ